MEIYKSSYLWYEQCTNKMLIENIISKQILILLSIFHYYFFLALTSLYIFLNKTYINLK